MMADQNITAREITVPPQNVNIPMVYANGFVSNLGTSDVSVILLADAAPFMKLNMSYTSAKTLCDMLKKAIDTLELATDKKIMDSAEVEKGLRAYMESKK
jgi:hypothetical protein